MFPNDIETFGPYIDGQIHWAAHQQELGDAITRIMTFIGTNGANGPFVPMPDTTTQIPAPVWNTVTAGARVDGTLVVYLSWYIVSDTRAVRYIIERAVTDTSQSTAPSTGWERVPAGGIAGRTTDEYIDSQSINSGYKYWYRIAAADVLGNTGVFSSTISVEPDNTIVFGDPDQLTSLYVYLDAKQEPIARWTFNTFNQSNNYYQATEIVVSASTDPADTGAQYYKSTDIAYPVNKLHIYELYDFSANPPDDKFNIDDTIYVHARTRNIFGNVSGWISASFKIEDLLNNYTTYQWEGWNNFKVLVENHFYLGGSSYTFDPKDFAADVDDLQYIGYNIAAGTIQTHALAVGSGHRNFDIIGVDFIQNDSLGADTDDNGWLRVVTTKANPIIQLIHGTSKEDPGEIYTWVVNKFEGDSFGTHPNTTGIAHEYAANSLPYYVYFKCSKTDNTDCDIVLSTDRLAPDGADHSTPNQYYWFMAGIWDVDTDEPGRLGLSYGFTFIDGNHITTGIIDANKVNIHGAGGDVVIDGSNIKITNGSMLFETADPSSADRVWIDDDGIHGTRNDGSFFHLTSSAGFSMQTGSGKPVHIDTNGIWTGTSYNNDSIWIRDQRISVYDTSSAHHTTFGRYDAGKYGILAGLSPSAFPRVELNEYGISCWNANGDLLFSTAGDGTFNDNLVGTANISRRVALDPDVNNPDYFMQFWGTDGSHRKLQVVEPDGGGGYNLVGDYIMVNRCHWADHLGPDGYNTSQLTNQAFRTIHPSSGSDVVADQRHDTLNISGANGIVVSGNAGSDTITIDGANITRYAFRTIHPSSGNDVVADSNHDTLTINGTGGITVTGNAGSDTITIDGSGVGSTSGSRVRTVIKGPYYDGTTSDGHTFTGLGAYNDVHIAYAAYEYQSGSGSTNYTGHSWKVYTTSYDTSQSASGIFTINYNVEIHNPLPASPHHFKFYIIVSVW